MKKQFYLLAATLLPLAAFAQPTLSKVEDYAPGTSVKMLNSAPVAAGSAGASQTWNFASLTANDTTTLTYMGSLPSSPFPAATLVEKSSDSIYRFFNKTAASTYLMGMVDSSSSGDNAKISYANTMLLIQRPLTYNATSADSFEHTVSSGIYTMTGKGEVKTHVDGYGTLTLPNGTYNNVLRVRIESNQKDTIGAPINTSFTSQNVAYVWYDNLHKAPLLRIDSMDPGGFPDVTVTYLHKEIYPVGISSIDLEKIKFYGFFNRGELNVTGDFANGRAYDINVFDLAGRTIHAETFTADGTSKNMVLQSAAPAGIYLVSVLQNDGKAAGYIKVAKDH